MKRNKDLKPGDRIRITILKNGYWVDDVGGTFLGWTKTGRARVRSHHWRLGYGKRVRTFLSENIKSDWRYEKEAT